MTKTDRRKGNVKTRENATKGRETVTVTKKKKERTVGGDAQVKKGMRKAIKQTKKQISLPNYEQNRKNILNALCEIKEFYPNGSLHPEMQFSSLLGMLFQIEPYAKLERDAEENITQQQLYSAAKDIWLHFNGKNSLRKCAEAAIELKAEFTSIYFDKQIEYYQLGEAGRALLAKLGYSIEKANGLPLGDAAELLFKDVYSIQMCGTQKRTQVGMLKSLIAYANSECAKCGKEAANIFSLCATHIYMKEFFILAIALCSDSWENYRNSKPEQKK